MVCRFNMIQYMLQIPLCFQKPPETYPRKNIGGPRHSSLIVYYRLKSWRVCAMNRYGWKPVLCSIGQCLADAVQCLSHSLILEFWDRWQGQEGPGQSQHAAPRLQPHRAPSGKVGKKCKHCTEITLGRCSSAREGLSTVEHKACDACTTPS